MMNGRDKRERLRGGAVWNGKRGLVDGESQTFGVAGMRNQHNLSQNQTMGLRNSGIGERARLGEAARNQGGGSRKMIDFAPRKAVGMKKPVVKVAPKTVVLKETSTVIRKESGNQGVAGSMVVKEQAKILYPNVKKEKIVGLNSEQEKIVDPKIVGRNVAESDFGQRYGEIEDYKRENVEKKNSENVWKNNAVGVGKSQDVPNGSSYVLGGRSPFINVGAIEKRPLSRSVPLTPSRREKRVYGGGVEKTPKEMKTMIIGDDESEKSSIFRLIFAVSLVIVLGGLMGALLYLAFFQN